MVFTSVLLQYKFCGDTLSTLQNMAHKEYCASLWIGWGSYSSTATLVAMCGTSTFPWMYNMFWADQRLTQYMQLWPWHYIMQARHCPDLCRLMYSMDCCSTQLSSPYTWKRTSMRTKILAHRIHGTSYRPRSQDLQLQLRCQELHPRPPWVHPDLQRWRALQGWICEVHGWILLQFFYNGFWLHVSNFAWIHPSDTILATRRLYINTALRFDRCTGFSKAKFCTDDWCLTWFNTVQLYNDSFNVSEVHVAVEAGC